MDQVERSERDSAESGGKPLEWGKEKSGRTLRAQGRKTRGEERVTTFRKLAWEVKNGGSLKGEKKSDED